MPFTLQHFWQSSNQLKSKWAPSGRQNVEPNGFQPIEDAQAEQMTFSFQQNQPILFEGQPPIGFPQFMMPQEQQPSKQVAPFPIQQPVLSYTGEVIIENTLGGVSFDCRFKPTGHWRDDKFCDVKIFLFTNLNEF